MTRKDYQLLAAAIRPVMDEARRTSESLNDPVPIAWVQEVADQLAEALAKDNPRFDTGKFLGAAGW